MIGPRKIVFQQSSSDEEDHLQNQKQIKMDQEKPQQNNLNEKQRSQQDEQYFQQSSFSQLGIPVQNFATLKGHNKTISCLAVDPKGHRVATGGLDYHVRLWDFHGMNQNMNSFRIIEPFTGNAIRNLCFNTTGSHLMVINGGKQVTFLDRDGARNLLTVKGYMYVKELHSTKGHTNTVYDGKFHPTKANQFVTCSGDGSIRLWDIQQKLEGIQQELAHKILIKCKDKKGLLTQVTGITYTNDGNMIYAGGLDGSLQGFSTKHNHHRPEMVVRQAHNPGQQYSCILSYPDSQKIVTRNTDNTLKIWDIRMFTKPILHYSNLPNHFPGSKMAFSPTAKLLLVGTSIGRQSDQKQSYLHFFDTTTFQKVKTLSVGTSSVTAVQWSQSLNQIFIGHGTQCNIYFDQNLGSVKGALKCYNKQPRVQKDPKFDYSHPIYLPHSLPLYKQRPTNNIKKDLLQIRKNPILSHKPHLPVQGPNKGGKVQNVAYTPIHHIIQSLNSNPQKVDDARKPLWELQKFTKQQPFFTSAYKNTQPELVANENPTQTKQFQFLQTIQKICPHCGLKLCTCIKKDIYQSDEEQEEQIK